MKKLNIDIVKLEAGLNELVDTYCDLFGIFHCIILLNEQCGFSKEDLLELNFDEEDIDYCLSNPAEALEEEAE